MWSIPKYLNFPEESLMEDSDSSSLQEARDMRTCGSIGDAERLWLPRFSAIPCYLEPVEVYRCALLVSDILIKSFVGIKGPKHVLL